MMTLRHAVRQHGGVNAAARALDIPITTFKRQLRQEYGGITRVVVIGDSHDKPGRDKRHYTWMGRYVADEDPDCVIHIGDFMSLDSLSFHEPKGSKQDRDSPTFPEDLESLDEALGFYHEGIPHDCGIPHHITFGNHEDRAWRAAEADPGIWPTLHCGSKRNSRGGAGHSVTSRFGILSPGSGSLTFQRT